MSEKSDEIEFQEWETIISGKEVYILSVGFSRVNEFGMGVEPTHHYLIPNTHFKNPEFTELLVRVFIEESEDVYQIRFSNVGAFRILDEMGLQEIINHQMNHDAVSTWPTLKVKNHGWNKESAADFFVHCDDGWSYMLLTGWDCLEVLTISEPVFIKESNTERLSGALPNILLN